MFTCTSITSKKRARGLVGALTMSIALIALPAIAQAGDGGRALGPNHPGKPIPGHYIVTLDASANPSDVAKAHGANPRFVYRSAINGFAAELNDHQVQALRRNPHVAAVEHDQVVTADNTQLTYLGQPWGLDRIDQRTGLNGSYVYNATASTVRAYVIDSGIQSGHAEFGGRASNMKDVFGGTGEDCNGHGTHVAGTIGGKTYGVAKAVLLRGVRVLDCAGGGTSSGVIAGIDWVRINAVKPAVANLSLSGGYDAALNAAVTRLASSGVFVAVAAGNSGADACAASPASAPGTFTVAASDSTDTRASFSNYGACVDGYAPGVSILSAKMGGGSTLMNGTSMASPHVAGVIALEKSRSGDRSSQVWVDWLTSNSTANVIRSNPSGTPNRLLFKGID